jgi:hypothetical protein
LDFQRQYGLNRRRFLKVGGAGLFGLSWSVLHKADVFAAQAKTERHAKQLVILWCNGGLGHLDCFDPKPDAPDTIRSPWPVAQTKVPGMVLGERVGSLARVADKITLLRSCNAKGYPEEGQHGIPAAWAFLTGTRRDTRERQPNSPQSPLYGNAMAHFRFGPGDVPPNVILGSARGHDSFLGAGCDPMEIKVNDPSDKLKQMLAPPPALLELDTLQRRRSLLESVNEQLRQLDAADDVIGGLDEFKQKAFDLLRSPKLREAVDLKREDPKSAERYGRADTGQRVLTARRLIEAGVPCVFVDIPGGWDWHGGGNLDRAAGDLKALGDSAAALIEDLDARGLLKTTIVMIGSEMGHTPKINRPGFGREHWNDAQSFLLAGGGLAGGAVVGATDKVGAYVTNQHYNATSLARTIYGQLGIDPDHELYTADRRPVKIVPDDAPVIKEAIG